MKSHYFFVTALLLTAIPISVSATTYFVDADGGNDDNAGATTSTAWRTPPGTRTTNNSGFVSGGTWGSISSTNKIKCGDTIVLKAGTTHSATDGGSWLIDSGLYTKGCSSAGLRIVVGNSANGLWSGAGGHFLFDGTGMSVYNGAGTDQECWPDHPGLVQVCRLDKITIEGQSEGSRFIVQNAATQHSHTEYLFQFHGMGEEVTDAAFRWFELRNARSGFNAGRVNGLFLEHGIIHDTSICGGLQFGMNADNFVRRAAARDIEIYNTGSATSSTGCNDAVFITGNIQIWLLDLIIRNNQHRGINTGCIWGPSCSTPGRYRSRYLQVYSNGTACPAANCRGAGIFTSHEETSIAENHRDTNTYLRTYSNDGGAGLTGYANAVTQFWNVTVFREATDGNYRPFLIDTTGEQTYLMNISHQHSTGFVGNWNTNNSGGTQRCLEPIMLNTCFRPLSNSSPLGFSHSNCSNFSTGTYETPPDFLQSSTNKLNTTTCMPNFANISGACATGTYSACDFTPGSGSSLIDAGRTFLLANGAGTGNTINVKANGGKGDPEDFFIAPNSFYLADQLPATYRQVQISGSCGVRDITSLSATSITFSGPACSWSDNAGVHIPYAGAAPDIGAIEFVGTEAPQSPLNLRVVP